MRWEFVTGPISRQYVQRLFRASASNLRPTSQWTVLLTIMGPLIRGVPFVHVVLKTWSIAGTRSLGKRQKENPMT